MAMPHAPKAAPVTTDFLEICQPRASPHDAGLVYEMRTLSGSDVTSLIRCGKQHHAKCKTDHKIALAVRVPFFASG